MKRKNKRLLTFLDIEASGIHQDSYPIEIGWCDTEGNSDEFLISPEAQWRHWSHDAERLHGISRAQLSNQGLDICTACLRLNDHLGCEFVYSDAGEADGQWLNKLFEAAGVEPFFTLIDLYDLQAILNAQSFFTLHKIIRANPPPHRALKDARRLAMALNCIRRAEDLIDSFVDIGLHSLVLLEKFPFSFSRSLGTLLNGMHTHFVVNIYGISHSELECVRKGVSRFKEKSVAHADLVVAFETNSFDYKCSMESDLAKKLIRLDSFRSQFLQLDLLQHVLAQLESPDFQSQIIELVRGNDGEF